MSNDPELKLRQNKPKPAQVNKTLVWTLFIIVFVVVISILVIALQPRREQQKSAKISDSFYTDVASEVKQLPASYADSDLSKYLPSQSPTIPQSVKNQLDQLKQQQMALESRLAALKSESQQADSYNGQLSDQAMHSALFFPGSAPQTSQMKQVSSKSTKTLPNTQSANSSQLTGYQKQNMQAQKIAFLQSDNKQDESDIYNMHTLQKPISPYEVQAGTLIPAVLLTAVNTSLPGEVVARVRSDVYNTVTGQFLLIPQGSKLIGQYDTQVSYGQSRVLIVFTRIIRPDGSSILLSKSPGSDLFGQAGMQGEVNNHWGRVIGAAVLSTILSVGAGAAASNSFSSNNQFYPTSGENALLGAAGSISQTGQNLANRAMNIQPTLIIPSGYEFNIIVNKDMVMAPYKPIAGQLGGGGANGAGVFYK